jgi:hypothetical protein
MRLVAAAYLQKHALGAAQPDEHINISLPGRARLLSPRM